MRTHRASAPKIETDVLKWEINPVYSRESGTLLAGAGGRRTVLLGSVLGLVIDGAATAIAAPDAGNVGNGVLTLANNPPVTTAGKSGVYAISCVEVAANGGTFQVEDPDGVVIGTAKVGVAFAKQVRFTIADGSTDFAAGDRFTISVDRGVPSGKFVPIDFAGTDGRQNAHAVSLIETYADDGQDLVDGLVMSARGSIVRRQGLVWPEGATEAQIAKAIAQLTERTVLVRTGY